MWWRSLLYQHIYYHVNHILWFGHNLLQKAREGRFPEKAVQGLLSALRAWFTSPNLGSWHALRYLGCPALLQLLVQQGARLLRFWGISALSVQVPQLPYSPAPGQRFEGIWPCQLRALCSIPCTLPFFWPLQSFVVLWVFCASLCLRASYRAKSYLELAAIFCQQNNLPRRSKNGIS